LEKVLIFKIFNVGLNFRAATALLNHSRKISDDPHFDFLKEISVYGFDLKFSEKEKTFTLILALNLR